MTRGEMKLRARSLILTNPPRPHPCLVTLALLAFIWIVNYLAQKIGGQPILIDLNAVQKLDYQNMIRIDFANAELVPTAILILFQLVDIVLSYGYIAYQLRVVRGEASGFGNLLDGFAITGRAIAHAADRCARYGRIRGAPCPRPHPVVCLCHGVVSAGRSSRLVAGTLHAGEPSHDARA